MRRPFTGLPALGLLIAARALGGDDGARLGQIGPHAAPAGSDAAAVRGARLFAASCAACHGSEGRGDGPGAADLDPPPRDLTSREFRFRTTPSGAPPRDEDLVRTIREGLPGTAMPAFGTLFDDARLVELVAFLRAIGPAADVPPPLEIDDVLATDDEASRRQGHALYLALGCWRCHGVTGAGDGPSAATLVDGRGHRLRATDFRHDPFKGGRETRDVVRALRTGLNGTPMPSYDEVMLLAREDPLDTEAIEAALPEGARAAIAELRSSSPARAELEALTAGERAALRDARLAALAHYVLSLSRPDRAAS